MCVTISWSERFTLSLEGGKDKPEVQISAVFKRRLRPPNRIGRNQGCASEDNLNVSFMPWVIKVRDDGDKERDQVGRIKNRVRRKGAEN